MTRAKILATFVFDHLGAIASFFAAGLTWMLLGHRTSPTANLLVDLDAAAEKRRVAEVQADQGAAAALAEVTHAYTQARSQLSLEDQHRAQALANDPPAMAAFLVRAAAGSDGDALGSGPKSPGL